MSELEEQLERNPDDAALFLVYADSLIEQGDRLGELIHLQHALSNTPYDEELKAREWKLRAEVAPGALLSMDHVKWRLGFPREVIIRYDMVVGALMEAVQTRMGRFIERITLSGAMTQSPRVMELLTLLPRLRAITYSPAGTDPWAASFPGHRVARALDHLPMLARLQELRFAYSDIDDIDISALASSRHRAPAGCRLVFEAVSLPFSSERRLSSAWEFSNAGFQGPALVVENPLQHVGRVFALSGPVRSGRIGHGAGCEFLLSGAGLHAVHAVVDFSRRTIRAVGNPGTAFLAGRLLEDAERHMEHGDLVMLGDAALRFVEQDVDQAREQLRARGSR